MGWAAIPLPPMIWSRRCTQGSYPDGARRSAVAERRLSGRRRPGRGGQGGAAGAKVTIRMPDFYPEFPYGWISWSDWLHAVNDQVTACSAPDVKNIEAWELWNEPDWTWIPGAAGSFDAGWARTYKAVRAGIPRRRSLAPASRNTIRTSAAIFDLRQGKPHAADIICWHELQGEDSIADDVKAYRGS